MLRRCGRRTSSGVVVVKVRDSFFVRRREGLFFVVFVAVALVGVTWVVLEQQPVPVGILSILSHSAMCEGCMRLLKRLNDFDEEDVEEERKR